MNEYKGKGEKELKEIKEMVDGIDASWYLGWQALLMTLGFVGKCMENSRMNESNK